MTNQKKLVVLLVVGILLVGIMVPFAFAQQQQDGLINVAIGDITVEDVNVGVAAVVAATICDLDVGPIAVLGRAVDRSGNEETICQTAAGPLRFEQN